MNAMTNEQNAMLARLIAQAEGEGAGLVTLRALAEEASEAGAERALERLGLADAGARVDIGELRQLLGAWRDAKRSARNEIVGWVVRIGLAMLLMGLAVRLGAVAPGGGAGALLWQHDAGRPVGPVEMLTEDKRGLRVIGHLAESSAAGREAAALLKGGAIGGLSFGYRVRGGGEGRPRELIWRADLARKRCARSSTAGV